MVTLPTERVSWNCVQMKNGCLQRVTLPTERVSWNFSTVSVPLLFGTSRSPRSVWVEIRASHFGMFMWLSRSPRSVWVEIVGREQAFVDYLSHAPHGACELKCSSCVNKYKIYFVTLPTERVSWNVLGEGTSSSHLQSRSPRSVWVEIVFWSIKAVTSGHAPHGACELKLLYGIYKNITDWVTLPTERVSWNLVVPELHQKNIVTLPTERVSWNWEMPNLYKKISRHAPHGACELKFP